MKKGTMTTASLPDQRSRLVAAIADVQAKLDQNRLVALGSGSEIQRRAAQICVDECWQSLTALADAVLQYNRDAFEQGIGDPIPEVKRVGT